MDMNMKEHPTPELWEPFLFTESSAQLLFVKKKLLSGSSVVIEPVYADASVGFLARVYQGAEWSADEMMELVALEDGGLGMCELHGLIVHELGTNAREANLINETLSAGFTLCLIADVSSDGRVVGSYILRASVSDNS